jgi:multiple sugar transport system permease protein
MVQRKNLVFETLYAIVLIFIVLYTLFPIAWALGNSLRADDSEIFRYVYPLSLHTFVPTSFALTNYGVLFSRYTFLVPILNSFFVAMTTVFFGFIVNGLAGYAFAKYRFRAQGPLFSIYLFSFMIPFEMIAVPLYKTVGLMGILNTRLALIMPMVANGMIVFLYRQFFKDIPDAIIESARMDGASTLRIFFQLITPLSKPVIISASLMTFIQQWDAFLWPLVAASMKKLKVIQVAIAELNGEEKVMWGVILAGTCIAILIPTCILIPLQKYYIMGISSTGMKE